MARHVTGHRGELRRDRIEIPFRITDADRLEGPRCLWGRRRGYIQVGSFEDSALVVREIEFDYVIHYPAKGAGLTVKEHIDAAIAAIEEERGGSRESYGREMAIALTALEDAKMRFTRGLAKKAGVFNEVDLEKAEGMARARENHEANVIGNEPGIARSA